MNTHQSTANTVPCSVNVLHKNYKSRLVVKNKVGIVVTTVGGKPVMYEREVFFCVVLYDKRDKVEVAGGWDVTGYDWMRSPKGET